MSLVVFLRGVNVAGHRAVRPSILARLLSDYGVVSVRAAGTFVVRKPGSMTKFCAALLRMLPIEAEVVIANGRDLIRREMEPGRHDACIRPWQSTGDGERRDAAEIIKLEIGHSSLRMTERTSLRNSARLRLKSWPFDCPKIVPNSVDATMVAR